SRFSKPVRFSSTAAYWPPRPISARTRAGSRATSIPPTRAVPPSGASSVVRIRTAVVFPAPFGPSSPRTLPRSAPNETPPSAPTAPTRFRRPSASIAGALVMPPSIATAASLPAVLPEGHCDRARNAPVDGKEVSVVRDEVARRGLHEVGHD